MRWAGAVIGTGMAFCLFYLRWLRPWHLKWGATPDEARSPMPGDDLVPHPTMCATRGVTIDAPVEVVWPWLAQMGGHPGAGWYSYDRFDKTGISSADRIIPELQQLSVGDVMLTSPREGFRVHAIDPGRSIVLNLEHGRSRITSVLTLAPLPGRRSRLVVRIRARFLPRHWLFAIAFDLGDFAFMRKQLLGIRLRAEHQWSEETRRPQVRAEPRFDGDPACRRNTDRGRRAAAAGSRER